jgi:F-type H+-transporting ATPase subunit a
MSGKLAHGHNYKGFKLSEETGKIVEINETGETISTPLDFSITKTVAGMMLAAIVILILFLRMGSLYKRKKNIVPKGFNGFLEPMIVFIRDEIAIPNIGHHKFERFMPYLLTAFFFILVNNIMGLIPFFPFGANVTGNIAVTMILALITFFITQISGTKDHWKHVFATPGVPVWLAPIMIPVELIGLFSKPFALMIRLFANITAGHIVVLSLVSLIFIFKALWVSSVSIPMVLFIDVLEILVAFLQAYVFTLLSALFIGLAAKEHHHA